MNVDDIQRLIELVVKYKLDILEIGTIKIVKQDHTVKAPALDMFEGKEPEMTEDEVDELLFYHEGV